MDPVDSYPVSFAYEPAEPREYLCDGQRDEDRHEDNDVLEL
jgi:hypothetical protein